MSARYSIRLRSAVRRTCGRCGCRYRTAVTRTTEEAGRTDEAAARSAARRLTAELAAAPDDRPCPGCGRASPAAVGRRRAAWHALVTGFAVLLFAAAAVAGSGWLAAAVALLAALGHAAGPLVVPDRPAAGSRDDDADEVTVEAEGDPERRPAADGRAGWRRLAVAATALAAGVALTPVLAARRTAARPIPAATGEPVRIEFAETIECLPGAWTGTPAVTVRNASAFPDGPPTVRVSSHTADGQPDPKAKPESPTLWAELVVPDDPTAAGRTLDLHVELAVRYTTADARGAATERTLTAARDVSIEVAAGTAAGRVRQVPVGTVGLLAAGTMLLAAGGLLRALAAPAGGRPPAVEVLELAAAPAGRDDRPTASVPRRAATGQPDEGGP
jgi:hypothetical protein